MTYDERWLPYLGDAVELHCRPRPVAGRVSTSDPALVLVEQLVRVEIGEHIAAAWRVGAERHDAVATVEDRVETGFTVRLPQPRVSPESRRVAERHELGLRLELSTPQAGSYGVSRRQGWALDLSDTGLRALVTTQDPLVVGEALQVRLEHGDEAALLSADVRWERAHDSGQRLAGLHLTEELSAGHWVALASLRGLARI